MSIDPPGRDDAAAMRRIVADLTADAPPSPSWTEIEQRSRADAPDVQVHRLGGRERRIRLVAVAASVAVVAGGGVALLAATGSGDEVLAPADTDREPTTTAELLPTTIPIEDPGATPLTTLPAPGNPDTIADTTILPTTSTPPTSEPAGSEPGAAPAQYDPRPLSEVTSLPGDAWVVAGTIPQGFSIAYTRDDLARIVAYSDESFRRIEIATELLQFPAGDPVTIGGREWLRSGVEDRVGYVAEIGGSMVTVSGEGVGSEVLEPLIADLVAGSAELATGPRISDSFESLTPVVADDELLASVSVNGAGGWYCMGIDTPQVGEFGCDWSRRGQLSSEVIWLSSGTNDVAEPITFASIVAPEVATVEVVIDGQPLETVTTRAPDGVTDDRFWIAAVDVSQVDPFVDPVDATEIRLLDVDGRLLGLAPLREF